MMRLADDPFRAAPEQHAVRHDRGDDAVALEDGQHVLEEHQVGLLAALGGVAVAEPLGVGERGLVVVLAERRVGNHPVEPPQFSASDVLGVGQGVVVPEVCVSDAMQQHVHLRDRPGGPVVLLPGEDEVGGVAAVVGHMVAGIDQHAARARARVVDRHALLWIHEAHHELDDRAGRVELTALLPGRVGEVTDQVLVGGAKQVGEFKVLVAQPILREVVDEVTPLAIRHLRGADPPVEVDVLQHPFQGGVSLLEGAEGLVQPVSHLVVHLVPQE